MEEIMSVNPIEEDKADEVVKKRSQEIKDNFDKLAKDRASLLETLKRLDEALLRLQGAYEEALFNESPKKEQNEPTV